ncbi:MAG: TonB-dependent receptor [Cytophagaceae bacterium]
MSKLFNFLIFLFILSYPIKVLVAQDLDKTYVGKVIDVTTGEKLEGAFIRSMEDSTLAVISDKKGIFSIQLPSHFEGKVIITFIGYQQKVVQLNEREPTLIQLSFQEEVLEEVIIKSEGKKKGETQSLSRQYVGKGLLSRNSSMGLGTAISRIDGVSFVSTGANIQLPVIHGLYGNRILILNNGFKHGFQNWGNDHAPEIDVAGAERITIVKGAGGLRYGPDALGGVVIVENHPMPLNKKLYGQVTNSYQSNGRGYGINASAGQGYKNFSYHIGGNYNRIGDRHTPDYMLTNTGAKSYALQAGVRYQRGNFDVKLNYSLINQNLGILRSSVGSSGPALIRNFEAERPSFIREFSYDINEPNQTARHQLASLSANWHYSENSYLTFKYARQVNERQEFDVRRNSELPIFDLDLITDDLQAEWNHSVGKKLNGIIGVQTFIQNNTNNPGTNVTPFIPNYRSRRFSVFGIENLKSGKNLWEAGIRYDFEESVVGGRDNRQNIFRDNFSFSNVTTSLGLVRELNSSVVFRSNIGSGWRPPNMAELFSFGQHEARTMFGLLRYEPDENNRIRADRVIPLQESGVKPEQSYKFINELELRKGKHRLNASAYVNYIGNFIFSRPIGVLGTARGPMPTFIIDQADALFTGVDLTYSRFFTPSLKGTFGASYIWSRNVERDEPLINQPPININYSLSWRKTGIWKLSMLEFSVEPSYTFRQFQAPRFISVRDLIEGNVELGIGDEIFDFQPAPDGYFLLNFFVRAEKNRFAASVEVTNALNTSYRDYLNLMRYFADDLGRNIILSLTYKF